MTELHASALPQRILPAGLLTTIFCVSTVFALNATDILQGEAFTGQSGGVTTEACSEGGQCVTSIENGDYLAFNEVDFGDGGIQCFEARIASDANGGYIEVRLDDTAGTLIGICEIQPVTGGWQTWTSKACAVKGATGIHTLYLKFTGGTGNLFNLNWFWFHGTPTISTAHWRQSTSTEKGTYKGTLNFSDAAGSTPTIEILPDTHYQRVDGFGAAFSDNGAVSIESLSETQRDRVMWELFDPTGGCKFNICRVPIGMSDFTVTRDYSLNETNGDYTMEHFSIAHDLQYNIPYIKAAMKFQPNLMIHASPWTPPTWMKTTNTWEGRSGSTMSTIKKDATTLTAYALYFRKFVQSWKQAGISVFAVYGQNEPGWTAPGHPSCGWSGAELKDFIRDYLYPDFQQNGIGTQLWIGTFHMSDFDNDLKPILEDTVARTMVRGCGLQREGAKAMLTALTYDSSLHWRGMETENMCYSGANSWSEAMETFGYLQSFYNSYTNSFMFWNMILNSNFNYVTWMPRSQNSLVTINTSSKTVTYNPEFYIMKHFSHYIVPGAVRIGSTSNNSSLNTVAFKNPDGSIILEVANNSNSAVSPVIKLYDKTITPSLPGKSANTFKMGGADITETWTPGKGSIVGRRTPEMRKMPSRPALGSWGIYDPAGRLIKRGGSSPMEVDRRCFLSGKAGAGKTSAGLYIIQYTQGKSVRLEKILLK